MAWNWAVLAVLLFLPINLVEAYAARNRVSAVAGHEAVLSCLNIAKEGLLMVTWKKNCKSCCVVSFRGDIKKTTRLNCNERFMWKHSPLRDPTLRIYPVHLGDEGDYTCETASSEGNFEFFASLTVIVPPAVTLTHDKSRVAVCQASAGKPAADISWIPASNHSSEEEFHHPNGTVTKVSYFGWTNSSFPSVTCLVTHPATNQTLVLDLTHRSQRILYILIGTAASVGVVSAVTICWICCCRGVSYLLGTFSTNYLSPKSSPPEVSKDTSTAATARWLRKRKRGTEEHFATKNSTLPPSRVRRGAAEPPDFPEQIYELYDPRTIYLPIV